MSPETMQQLSLDAGGATVDTSVIDGVKFAKGVKDLEEGLTKGSDVHLTIIARVTDVKLTDKYDAHGNVAETLRKHTLRIDGLDVVSVTPEQYKIAAEEDLTIHDPEE